MDQFITVRTDLFNYTEVKPHFINPCCFGEDFAQWLRDRLLPLESSGFEFSDSIQEDYGWGLWARKGKDSFWVSVGPMGSDGPEEYDGEWGISVGYDPGLNIVKRLFHNPGLTAYEILRSKVADALESEPAIHTQERQ
jgi:hypothetical protein